MLRILIGATGSVDVTALPGYLRAIKAAFPCTITLLMTHTAGQFLPAETLNIWADRVIAGESPTDWPTDKPSKIVADHDLLLVLPATANILAQVAQGAAPNRLAVVIMAATFPVIFFPAMGGVMWQRPAVQRNVAQLREDGYEVCEPTWVEHHDTALNKRVRHPSLPPEERLVVWLQRRLSARASATV
ncbi:flavoprotein [Pantoea sp. 1.19]|uniref:flavoprotein n=1 Tax=Pantoea sp. 1.19 TaxID=1925589 RepID=UPI000948F1A2|nr:flavoprotein [Pantoea sp. 1.19]